MQWLIDLVIEAIGIPPTYVHRGDPADWDFILGDLTTDDAWHELDLSAIVPEGASAVHLHVVVNNANVAAVIQFRDTSQSDVYNVAFCKQFVAAVSNHYDIVQKIDSNRKIDYNAVTVGWAGLYISVRGWWL